MQGKDLKGLLNWFPFIQSLSERFLPCDFSLFLSFTLNKLCWASPYRRLESPDEASVGGSVRAVCPALCRHVPPRPGTRCAVLVLRRSPLVLGLRCFAALEVWKVRTLLL